MIHPYTEDKLDLTMSALGEMFELAVMNLKMDIDYFAIMFANSKISESFEKCDYINIYGKSSNELLALVIGKEPQYFDQPEYATPAYWVGYMLAFNQWYYNCTFADLLFHVPASKLLLNYFPYHEMDITKSTEIFKKELAIKNKLKLLRLKKNFSQSELAFISGVPLRNIKAYERGQIELSKASGETLYQLATTLNCTIEQLIV